MSFYVGVLLCFTKRINQHLFLEGLIRQRQNDFYERWTVEKTREALKSDLEAGASKPYCNRFLCIGDTKAVTGRKYFKSLMVPTGIEPVFPA